MGNKLSCIKPHDKVIKSNRRDHNRSIQKAFNGPPGSYVVMAMYSYHSSSENGQDISFEKGEIMYVTNDDNGTWYKVMKDCDRTTGLVPANYVKKQDGSPTSVEAWRDIQRWEAERLLMRVGLDIGTYVIRPSKKLDSYAISVRDVDDDKNSIHVKNFQIKVTKTPEKTTYTVNTKNFPDILTMIDFYKKNGIGSTKVKLHTPLPDHYVPPVHFKDIEVNRESIVYIEEIGRGHFGLVYKAKWGRNYMVAAKVLHDGKTDPTSRSNFLTEARIMHKLRHRKIVEILGVCTEPIDMPMMIIVEYMANGSLKEYLQKNGQETKIPQCIEFMKHIAEGMDYLEKENIVHRDLRADNVLVADDLTVKVSDFGLTNMMSTDNKNTENKITKFPYKWTAPEAAATKIFNSKSDVWSYGVVQYEIITKGSQPYPGMKGKDVIREITNGYRMPNPTKLNPSYMCPQEIYDLMLLCWNEKPEDRPSFFNIMEYLESYNTSYVLH